MAFTQLIQTSSSATKSSRNGLRFNLASLFRGREAQLKARKIQYTPPTPPRARRTPQLVDAPRTRKVERLVFPTPLPVVIEEFSTEECYPEGWAREEEEN